MVLIKVNASGPVNRSANRWFPGAPKSGPTSISRSSAPCLTRNQDDSTRGGAGSPAGLMATVPSGRNTNREWLPSSARDSQEPTSRSGRGRGPAAPRTDVGAAARGGASGESGPAAAACSAEVDQTARQRTNPPAQAAVTSSRTRDAPSTDSSHRDAKV